MSNRVQLAPPRDRFYASWTCLAAHPIFENRAAWCQEAYVYPGLLHTALYQIKLVVVMAYEVMIVIL